jgi:hypothetical protein
MGRAVSHEISDDSLACHARPCAGHPRISKNFWQEIKIVDGLDKPGHDKD